VGGTTCASCGATIAADAQWCSLCYAPVAVAADPAEAGELEAADLAADLAEAGPDATTAYLGVAASNETAAISNETTVPQGGHDLLVAPVPTPAPASAPDEATWPCLNCGAANPMTVNACAACGLAFLSDAKTPPRLVLPVIGDLFQRSRSQQIGFIAAAGFSFLAVLLGLMTLLGLIF
jgi:hypothetical protein